MSRELQALEIIKNAPTIYVGCASDIYTRYSHECKIIENALKNYEELTNKPVVLYGRTQALIDMICKTHKEIKVINLIDERKVKAFDTIKEKQVDVYILLKTKSLDEYNEWYVGIQDNFMPLTQDEYDLLKEVLL